MSLRLRDKLHQDRDDKGRRADNKEKRGGIDKGKGRQVSHSSDVAEGACHTGDLAGHSALDQRHDCEHRTLSRLNKNEQHITAITARYTGQPPLIRDSTK